MANTWGTNRTGYDKELFDLGKDLENAGSIETVQKVSLKLRKILDKMEYEQSVKRIQELREVSNLRHKEIM